MSLTKSHQALSDKQVKNAVARMGDYRFATRNRAIISLGLYAGLRACEIGAICWKDVLTADDAIGDELRVRNLIARASMAGDLLR
jgi:integrase